MPAIGTLPEEVAEYVDALVRESEHDTNRINWIADEFSYSIGGISLDLDKSSKYESAYSGASEQFDKQLERAKLTVKFIRGLQQPKYGIGIRSSFGPYVGRGVLTPSKFMGV